MDVTTLRPQDFWDVAVRRRWLICGTLGTCIAIAVILCVILPKSYRSKTVIFVENQRIPERYVSPVMGGTVGERVNMVQQSVMSRTFLRTVAGQYSLYPPNATDQQIESVIDGLLQNIKIELKGGRSDARVESFTISFSDSNPVKARDVTAMFADEVIKQNIRSRELLVEGTTKFLDEEMQGATASLEEQERAMASFKKRHMGELPGQVDANLQTLSRLQRDLVSTNESLQDRLDRRMAHQKMISSYEAIGSSFSENAGGGRSRAGGATGPIVSPGATARNIGPLGDPLATRLRELERQLMTLTAEYRDAYPDVIHLKQEIAQVKARIAEKQVPAQRESKDETPPDKPKSAKPQSSVDPYVYDLKRELDENEIGISALKEQLRRLTVQTREYEQRVEKAPEREQELLVLQRDYQNTRRNYESLLEKQLNARISENLEKHQAGETFRILDAADIPMRPESPDMFKIMMSGLVLGCGLGYGTAFGLEFMSRVIRRPEEAESLLGLPVLATIPDFQQMLKNMSGTKELLGPNLGVRHQLMGNGVGAPSITGTIDSAEGEEKEGKSIWKKAPGSHRSYPPTRSSSGSARAELNLITKWRPASPSAEQFRVAATRLVLMGAVNKSTVVLVTSAVKGEGKSTTACNLAYVLGNDLGKSVLLMDCDFKRPTLHEYCGVPVKPGLAEAIYGDVPLHDCFHQKEPSGISILPAGRRDHRLVDLTKIPQVSSIIGELRNKFEYIVVDAPPILPLADMNLLAGFADMIVLVVRAGVTPHDEIQRAMKSLKPVNRAGIILVGTQTTLPSYLDEYYAVGQGSSRK